MTMLKGNPSVGIQAKQQEYLRDTSQTPTAQATMDYFELNWEEMNDAPSKMYRNLNAIVDGDMVYFTVVSRHLIYRYNSGKETWDQLPTCPMYIEGFALAVVNYLLTIIGGKSSSGKVTNQLISLRGSRWKQEFQSMPTKRTSAVAVNTGQALIVIGGVGQDGKPTKKVEIMDFATYKWSSAADLPDPKSTLANITATICQDRIYLLGGFFESLSTGSVHTCTLSNLLQSSRSKFGRFGRSTVVWEKVDDLPVKKSTCVALNGRLLAIGGCDTRLEPTSEVYMYNPEFNTWEVVSRMKVTRRLCFAVVLPNNKLMVVGGRSTSSSTSETDSVEITTIV